jgi:hypothetical protein
VVNEKVPAAKIRIEAFLISFFSLPTFRTPSPTVVDNYSPEDGRAISLLPFVACAEVSTADLVKMSAAQEEFNELMRDKERRTRHPEDEDNDDRRSFLNLTDDEDTDRTPPASQVDPEEISSRPSMSQSRNRIPLTRYGANTGPKGVISDAQNFRDAQRLHRISMRSTSTLASQAPNRRGSPHLPPPPEKLNESEEDDELDDDFMRQWRNTRLRELQNGKHGSKMHSRERSRRLWGTMQTVDGEGYLDAVDKSPAETVVLVYIYDNYVSPTMSAAGGRYANKRTVRREHSD